MKLIVLSTFQVSLSSVWQGGNEYLYFALYMSSGGTARTSLISIVNKGGLALKRLPIFLASDAGSLELLHDRKGLLSIANSGPGAPL